MHKTTLMISSIVLSFLFIDIVLELIDIVYASGYLFKILVFYFVYIFCFIVF